MDHIAIMDPRRGLISKILSGHKTVESRWYQTRRAPWDKIRAGETVYFKDSGKPVTAKAKVAKVLQFELKDLADARVVAKKYGKAIMLANSDPAKWGRLPRYCILVFLSHPTPIIPFAIDKTGFGAGAAWITISKVSGIKK